LIPVRPIGRLVLDQVVDNFFAETEQEHIKDALVFELSKVKEEKIHLRVVANLLNVCKVLAKEVADELGLETMPEASEPARKPIEDLPKSDALSILKNVKETLQGRTVGVLVTEGTDQGILDQVRKLAESEGLTVAIVAPKIGGVRSSTGELIRGDQKFDGGPSVLYDYVMILPSDDSKVKLAEMSAAKDFVAHAFAHHKFIAFTEAALPLFKSVSLHEKLDDGTFQLGTPDDVENFLSACKKQRFWDR
jgi:catalase